MGNDNHFCLYILVHNRVGRWIDYGGMVKTILSMILITVAIMAGVYVLSPSQQEHVKPVGIKDDRFLAPAKYSAWVGRYAAQYGVPMDIAIRLAYEESKWDETAMGKNRNGTYDHGLYQLNSRYYRVSLPETNIRDGLRHLGKLIKESATIREAIMKYNAGPNFYAIHGYWPKKSMELAERVVNGGI